MIKNLLINLKINSKIKILKHYYYRKLYNSMHYYKDLNNSLIDQRKIRNDSIITKKTKRNKDLK